MTKNGEITKEQKIERFCQLIAEGKNQTEAYSEAFGVPKSKARQAASNLKKTIVDFERKVEQYKDLKFLRENNGLIADDKEISMKLTEVFRTTNDANTIVKIADILNKMNKVYTDDRTMEEREEEKRKKLEEKRRLKKINELGFDELMAGIKLLGKNKESDD